MRSLITVLTVIVVLGTGCASEDAGSGGASNDPGSTGHPAPTRSTTPNPAPDETPRTDLTDEHPVEWTSYEKVSDHQLRFFFTSGTAKCYGARAVVQEGSSTIWVATIVGTLPDAPAKCSLIALKASILVTTKKPLDDRRIVHLEPKTALLQSS